MNESSPELTRQVLHPAVHQKLLLRAAEVIAQGWTRGTAARDADGQKVRSTAPQARAWCVVGALDRAFYELLNLDVYDLLGLEVDAYDIPPASSDSRRDGGLPILCSTPRADDALEVARARNHQDRLASLSR